MINKLKEELEFVNSEAEKLLKEGRANSIKEATSMAIEILESKLTVDETVKRLNRMEKDIRTLKVEVNQDDPELGMYMQSDIEALKNAIAYLENPQESHREGKDTTKVLFILEQKANYKNAYFVKKLYEEVREFEEALENNDTANQFEEILDVIQIAIATIAEVLKPTESELWRAIATHNEKLLVDRHYKTRQVALEFKGLEE